MKELNKILILIFVSVVIFSCKNQEKSSTSSSVIKDPSFADDRGYFRLMFYNAENFFDCMHDTLKKDDEFLPEGAKHWTESKFKQKALNLCKVITAIGGWEPPEVVGLCEVENDNAINQLLQKTPLSKFNYQSIHFESPDNRGIDVVLLYRKNKFFPIDTTVIPVIFPFDGKSTRDVLYVKGSTTKDDTLHIFINHWPSRWGGQLESEPRRMYVASVVKHVTDSIFKTNPKANIIITGDFNDEPENKSIIETLDARTEYDKIKLGELYNISYYQKTVKGMGSDKYNGEWGIIDNMIVSGGLLHKKNSIYTTLDDAHIFNSEFLLEKDDAHFGFKPFRTYIGFKYNGGYSDHLPIFIDIRRNN